jgi:hypothetical protein
MIRSCLRIVVDDERMCKIDDFCGTLSWSKSSARNFSACAKAATSDCGSTLPAETLGPQSPLGRFVARVRSKTNARRARTFFTAFLAMTQIDCSKFARIAQDCLPRTF